MNEPSALAVRIRSALMGVPAWVPTSGNTNVQAATGMAEVVVKECMRFAAEREAELTVLREERDQYFRRAADAIYERDVARDMLAAAHDHRKAVERALVEEREGVALTHPLTGDTHVLDQTGRTVEVRPAADHTERARKESDGELLAALEQLIPYTWRQLSDFESVLRGIGVFVRCREGGVGDG